MAALFLGIWLVLGSLVFVCAGEKRVFDDAGLLSAEEALAVQQQIELALPQIPVDLLVHTTDGIYGQTVRAYADGYYEAGGFGKGKAHSGLVLVIAMQTRDVYISTEGEAIVLFTDARIQEILDEISPYLSDGEYYSAVQRFVQMVKEFCDRGVQSGQYIYDEETGKITVYRSVTLAEALIAAALALLCGAVTFFAICKSYSKQPTTQSNYAFRQNSTLTLTEQSDVLVNQIVTRRKIPKPPPSSGTGGHSGHSAGRSTVHRSSGGRTHGGGGRKF